MNAHKSQLNREGNMANILVSLEHGVEVGAADVLRFLTITQSTATKLEPGVIAALGVLLGMLEKTMTTSARLLLRR